MAELNFNRIILGGRVAYNPESISTSTGKDMCKFTLTVHKYGKNYMKEQTDMDIKCIAFGNTAKMILESVKPWYTVIVDGQLDMKYWVGKGGGKDLDVSIIVDKIYFVEDQYERQRIDASREEKTKMPEPVTTESEPNFETVGEDGMLPF